MALHPYIRVTLFDQVTDEQFFISAGTREELADEVAIAVKKALRARREFGLSIEEIGPGRIDNGS